MGYRDDLIERMQQSETWTHMTSQQQANFCSLTDDQARQFLVLCDRLDMGDLQAHARFGIASLNDLVSSFRMNLVELGEDGAPALTRAGGLLAKFVEEVQEKGLDSCEIEQSFKLFDSLAIKTLMMVYKKLDSSEGKNPKDK